METYSAKMVEHLGEFGEVESIYLKGNDDGSAPGFLTIIAFGFRSAAKLIFVRTPADIVHIGDMASWPLAMIARLRSHKSTVAISAHGTDVSYPGKGGFLGALYGAYMRLGARIVKAKVLANSPATSRLVESLGFSPSVSIPLGTDIKPRGDPELGQNVLFAGRLLSRKGCAWFIENVLPKLPSEIELDVAGTIWDESERRALEAPRVHYVGKLDRDDLVAAYANALCVVVPNIETTRLPFEGFGLVAVEAAAAGGVVVSSATSGVEAAVIDGKTGFKCPPEDPESWVNAITRLAAWSPEERREFVANSLAETQSYYSWQRVARETFAAYAWTASVHD